MAFFTATAAGAAAARPTVPQRVEVPLPTQEELDAIALAEAEDAAGQEEEGEEDVPQVGGQASEEPDDSGSDSDDGHEDNTKTTVDDLFKEAKFVKESQKSRILEKIGNYPDTLRDFKRLSPRDIKKISMRDGKEVNIGRLSDGRTAIARNRSSGDNSPTLEIQAPGAKRVIKIRYMPNN